MKRIVPSKGLGKKPSPPEALYPPDEPNSVPVDIVSIEAPPPIEVTRDSHPFVDTIRPGNGGLVSFLEKEVKLSNEGPPHLIQEARAGTGKTTTNIEGLKVLKGIAPRIIPSPQQQAIWDAICLSKDAKTIAMVAFNSSIADELKRKVPKGVDAMTMHSMGNRAVTKAFGRQEPVNGLAKDILADILDIPVRTLQQEKPVLVSAVGELVGHVKKNLAQTDPDSLQQLASHYDVELDRYANEVFDLVPKVLYRMRSPKGKITFDDMIWLPIALGLPLQKYDLLIVDEAQDLNRCQQELAKQVGRRLILCGDPKQAIYGFAGADCDSMPRMFRELSETPRGCQKLPLTVTRRCGKAIVKEANKIVPEFEAFETNPEGLIREAKFGSRTDPVNTYHEEVRDGDFLLCRVNAPLVSQCFRFIRMGRKANIQGRDIGAQLVSTIDKMKAPSVVALVARLDNWLAEETSKEQAKRDPSEQRLIALQDRYDCLLCFTEGAETIDDVKRKIGEIFTDDKDKEGIRLSSVHKAKGLEAKRVYILMPEGASMPHPMARTAWQQEQEMNLKYVAITRAIEELVWVY